VWTINANGGTPQPLEETNAANTNKELAWWPSREIVYQKPGIRNYLRINGRAQTAVLQQQESLGWVPFKPIFSPDGNKVALFRNRQPDLGLWIISLEPYSETLVLAGIFFPFGWSPDGKYVYVQRPRSGEIIRVRSTPPNEITSVATLPGGYSASVSPEGRQIILSVAAEASDVWLMENLVHGSANPQPVLTPNLPKMLLR
jgi:Tol biopolymer transport system component